MLATETLNGLRSKHPHALLLFRTGLTVEAYGDDARQLHGSLGLRLTTRAMEADGGHVAVASFPAHHLDGYLRKLINDGFRVAILEQVK